jgi:hypothetical protein
MSHDRTATHFGEYPATLVELSSAIDVDLTAGMTVQEVLAELHARISDRENSTRTVTSFTGDAYISLDWTAIPLADDKGDAYAMDLVDMPATGVTLSGDISANATEDATDPSAISDANANSDLKYVGWARVEVSAAASGQYVRVYTADSEHSDTILFMFKKSTAPTASDDPEHGGDDNFSAGYHASLHEVGDNADGTDYVDGGMYSEDTFHRGVPLTTGTYWFAVCPYDSGDYASSNETLDITFQKVWHFTGDAKIVAA